MKKNIITHLVLIGVLIVVVLSVSFLVSLPDGKMHVVFCDVGQGDATYIQFPDGTDMLIDGGPGDKVLECLGAHMAFYDREIEIVAMTHPHHDHYAGLIEVVKRYDVGVFLAPPVDNNNKSFGQLKKLIVEKQIPIRNMYQNDEVILDFNNIPCAKGIKGLHNKCEQQAHIRTLWPTKEWLIKSLENTDELATKNALGVGDPRADLNDFSVVFWVSIDDFDVLIPGDLEAKLLIDAINGSENAKNTDFEVLKVPHHGSVGSVSTDLLDIITPDIGVITVGAKNRYGHPAKSTQNLMKARGIDVFRTDVEGDVVVTN